MTHIILLDGKLWAFEPPEKPNDNDYQFEEPYQDAWEAYNRAYSLALEQKLEVENPHLVVAFYDNTPIKENEPIKWEGGFTIINACQSDVCTEDGRCEHCRDPKKLVRLIAPVKEEPEYAHLTEKDKAFIELTKVPDGAFQAKPVPSEQEKQEEMFTMDQMLDLVAAFNISTSCESVEDAKEEFPNLFKSKRRVAKEWITKVITRK